MVNKGLIAEDAQTGVGLCGFLGTVALFFTGLLISQFNSFSQTIRIPILMLVISTLGFIFSATLYANASGIVSRGKSKLALKFMAAGNAISEYLGIYLFVMSIPLVMNAATSDEFLRVSTGIVTIVGLLLYSLSNFSMFNLHISKLAKRVLAISISVIGALLFWSQLHWPGLFLHLAVGFVAITLLETAYHYRKS